jgi:protein-tyrosine phosphatase
MIAELYWLPNRWPGRLAIAPRPRGSDWLEDELTSWKRVGVEVVVSLLTADESSDLDLQEEERLTHSQGMEFVSIPIADRSVPDSTEVIAGVAAMLAAGLKTGRNVVIHCRQGIGRSALVAAAVLTVLGVSAESAFQQIAATRGCPVPETPEQRSWIVDFARRQTVSRTAQLTTQAAPDPSIV